MAQGKMKIKTKLPNNIKSKKSTNNKGPAVSKRANRPIAPKKTKFQEAHKIKKTITKTLNKTMEEDIRSIVNTGKKNFSKVEQAVANYNTKRNESNVNK